MRSSLEILKERTEIYAKGTKSKGALLNILRNVGLKAEDVSKEYGYLNIRIPGEGGYVRICKPKGEKEFKVQMFEKIEMRYSGIPTFEPSGRRSF